MFKRILSTFLILMLTCSFLAACGNAVKNNNNEQPEEINRQQEEINEQTEEQTPPSIEEEKHSGEYLGQSDNNSIEVKVIAGNGEPQIWTFQLSEEIKENFSSYNLKSGDKIYFKYETHELGYNIITEIEKAK